MNEEKPSRITWMDVLWLFFLLGLAVLPPVREPHKQLMLLAIGVRAAGRRPNHRQRAAIRAAPPWC